MSRWNISNLTKELNKNTNSTFRSSYSRFVWTREKSNDEIEMNKVAYSQFKQNNNIEVSHLLSKIIGVRTKFDVTMKLLPQRICDDFVQRFVNAVNNIKGNPNGQFKEINYHMHDDGKFSFEIKQELSQSSRLNGSIFRFEGVCVIKFNNKKCIEEKNFILTAIHLVN